MTIQKARLKSATPALLAVPPKVYDHGLRDFHERPLVSDGKDADGKFTGCWRVSPADAWDHVSLELRAANSWPCLILDIDSRLDGTGAERLATLYWGDIPLPNWTVMRESSGGVHAVWCLARPVHRGEAARAKPMRLLRRSAEYLALLVGADAGYTGVLTHNPMARAQGPDLITNWLRREPWGLHELAAWVPKGWRSPRMKACQTDIGRNAGVFDALRRFAGSPKNVDAELMPLAEYLNATFPTPPGPLPERELARIVANVERKRAEWIREGKFYTAAEASEYQAGRGRIGGKCSGQSRRDRVALRDAEIVQAVMAGRTLREVAAQHGIKPGTVRHVIRRDAPAFEPPPSTESERPWEAAGVSRRTWYYWQAKRAN